MSSSYHTGRPHAASCTGAQRAVEALIADCKAAFVDGGVSFWVAARSTLSGLVVLLLVGYMRKGRKIRKWKCRCGDVRASERRADIVRARDRCDMQFVPQASQGEYRSHRWRDTLFGWVCPTKLSGPYAYPYAHPQDKEAGAGWKSSRFQFSSITPEVLASTLTRAEWNGGCRCDKAS